MPAGSGWKMFCDPTGGNTTMARFLAFAARTGAMPDVLAWHEWGSWGREVPRHVTAVREHFAAAPELGAWPVPAISINEIITGSFGGCQTGKLPSAASEYWKPGAIVGWLANIVAANVSSGWSHWDGANPTCVLDGKLTCYEAKDNYGNGTAAGAPGMPRASYWTHRAYSALTGKTRVYVATATSTTTVASGPADAGGSQLLASYDKGHGTAAVLSRCSAVRSGRFRSTCISDYAVFRRRWMCSATRW